MILKYRSGTFNIHAYTPCMNYCGQCGASVERIIPAGDTKPRDVCSRCGHIHYENPRIIAGCLPVLRTRFCSVSARLSPDAENGRFQRAFLKMLRLSKGAARQTLEEANARVHSLELYTLFSLPHISQVYMFYRAELSDLDFSARRGKSGGWALRGKRHSLG